MLLTHCGDCGYCAAEVSQSVYARSGGRGRSRAIGGRGDYEIRHSRPPSADGNCAEGGSVSRGECPASAAVLSSTLTCSLFGGLYLC